MAFRFPLKALWRVRAIYEKRERQRLEAVAGHLVRMQNQVAGLRQDRVEQVGSLSNGLQQGMTGAELQFHVMCLAAHQRRINSAVRVVEDLSQQHQQRLAAYRTARQKVDVMERLYERQFSAYRTSQARSDQQQATDLFLIRSHPKDEGQ